MAIDTSFYSNLQPVKAPDVLDSASKAMNLSQMALQNQQAQRTFAEQDALRQAISKNANPDGTLNREGVLSDLAKTNPNGLMTMQQHFATQDKAASEAQSAKADALEKVHAAALPGFEMLRQKGAGAYPAVYQSWKQSGLPMQNVPTPDSDPATIGQWFSTAYPQIKSSVAGLNAQKSQSEIAKNNSEVAQAPAKLNEALHGRGAPEKVVGDEYNERIKPYVVAQSNMSQMNEALKNPSPYSDESMLINAMKIKNPGATDVNSIEQIANAQSAGDNLRKAATKYLQGGFDQSTRENLYRDAGNTFNSVYKTYQGEKDRSGARLNKIGVPDSGLINEPAIENTYNEMQGNLKKIGPYVPPSDRGGVMAGLTGIAGKVFGIGGNQTAAASDSADKSSSNYRPVGSSVSSDEVAQYAMKHNMKLSDAQTFLKGRGYAIGK
jgi:hypothetical protein